MKPINPVKAILASIILLFNVFSGYSQESCGFDKQHRAMLKNNSFYKKAIVESENKVKALLADKEFMKVQAPVYTIPVVVHVIHKGESIGTGSNISVAQIQSAINSLTQYYRGNLGLSADAELQFQLASLDPNCNPTTGIVRIDGRSVTNYDALGVTLSAPSNEVAIKALSNWPTNYYNIWVVSEIEGNDGGGGIQGFATFPGASASVDGSVVLASSFGYDPGGSLGYALKGYTNLNTTLAHEIGHALGLYHTFEGDDIDGNGTVDGCPPNSPTTCTTDGDMVCDTDPHIRSNSDCPTGANSCKSPNSLTNIVHNLMDYSSEACKNNFTVEQVARMRAYLTALRPGLINSLALSATPPISPYVAPIAAVFTPNTVTLSNAAGIFEVTLNQRTHGSSVPSIDGGYVNRVNSCLNLIQLFRGVAYTLTVRLRGLNHEQFGAWLDYNNDGDFLDANEQLALSTHVPMTGSNIIVSVNFTVPGTAPLNTAVRLRVIDDISTNYGGIPDITVATHTQHGQAEDYPVYFSTVLPIVLHNFTGVLSDNHSKLQWSASSDQHSKGFDIERSYNGTDFKKIGYVPVTHGPGTQPRMYSFADPEAALENNYYRLRQWDIDNKFEYSNTIFIKSSKKNGAGFAVLNNPFNNYIDITFDKPLKGNADIRLIDITGQEVFSKTVFTGTDQKLRIDLSGKSLLKGIYILEIRSNGEQYAEKLIKH